MRSNPKAKSVTRRDLQAEPVTRWNPKAEPVPSAPLSGVLAYSGREMDDGLLLCAEVPEGEEASVLLYRKGQERPEAELSFSEGTSCGRMRVMRVTGVPAEEAEYNFRIGNEVVTDPFARLVHGREHFADPTPHRPHQVRGAFMEEAFDWGGDKGPLRIPLRESILYELNVRGFTKSPTSGVKHKGTFLGLEEKLPYLQSLGITGVMLMPCFEFDEVSRAQIGWRPAGIPAQAGTPVNAPDAADSGQPFTGTADLVSSGATVNAPSTASLPPRLNAWGYGPGWYFAPKRSYCATDNPADELRHMVRSFHTAGIEVLLELSFPEAADPCLVRACLLWWRLIYHIDGFMLLGQAEEMTTAVRTGALSDVKILYDYFDTGRMYPKGRPAGMKHLAEYNVGFRYDARRFLKGDADSLGAFVVRARRDPEDAGVVNGITGHDGFTLYDLVSYNDKHNEANGESGRDGAEQEFSWNCGVEGSSRKREVSRLRMRQMKNALALMLLSQGTPMLTAGDECLRTQEGNSNPYCHDSRLTWFNWSRSKGAEELLSYVRDLIALRKAHPCLHPGHELRGDTTGGPFPDYSVHGTDAWFASFDRQERSVGLLYCDSAQEDCVYVAYNMHWEERMLALPYLPKGREWHCILRTAQDRFSGAEPKLEEEITTGENGRRIKVPGRSILVLTDGPKEQQTQKNGTGS